MVPLWVPLSLLGSLPSLRPATAVDAHLPGATGPPPSGQSLLEAVVKPFRARRSPDRSRGCVGPNFGVASVSCPTAARRLLRSPGRFSICLPSAAGWVQACSVLSLSGCPIAACHQPYEA